MEQSCITQNGMEYNHKVDLIQSNDIKVDPMDKFPFTIGSDGMKVYNSGDIYNISWKGTTIDDFEFLDQTAEEKSLYYDCRFVLN